MAWNDIGVAINDADKWLFDVFSADSACVKQTSMWGFLKTFFNDITSHYYYSPEVF